MKNLITIGNMFIQILPIKARNAKLIQIKPYTGFSLFSNNNNNLRPKNGRKRMYGCKFNSYLTQKYKWTILF